MWMTKSLPPSLLCIHMQSLFCLLQWIRPCLKNKKGRSWPLPIMSLLVSNQQRSCCRCGCHGDVHHCLHSYCHLCCKRARHGLFTLHCETNKHLLTHTFSYTLYLTVFFLFLLGLQQTFQIFWAGESLNLLIKTPHNGWIQLHVIQEQTVFISP